jgi:hypothetical protein
MKSANYAYGFWLHYALPLPTTTYQNTPYQVTLYQIMLFHNVAQQIIAYQSKPYQNTSLQINLFIQKNVWPKFTKKRAKFTFFVNLFFK